MIVKSFLLKQSSLEQIVANCSKDTIAIVRPEKSIEGLFREAVRKTIEEKKSAREEFQQMESYFQGLTLSAPESPAKEAYKKTVESTLEAVAGYLREGMWVQAAQHAIEDYVMAKCARLCAEAVNVLSGGKLIDGTELMLCHEGQHFDWAASQQQILQRCSGEQGLLVIPGGYGRLGSGYVVRVGKDGAHLMASLIGATLKATSIEFYIEGKGIEGMEAITYDEAAHYCSSAHAPFSSSALWPAKNAGIPILVKDIQDQEFKGTLISAHSSHKTAVLCEGDLDLITVYGTGLLGRVGMSGGIFSALAAAKINVRFIAQTSSEYSISFAVRSVHKDAALEAIGSLFKDNPLLPLDDVVVLNRSVGIVTVFGSRMRNEPGVSGTVFGKLGAQGINIIASAQGGEELSISLVVDSKDLDRTAGILKA